MTLQNNTSLTAGGNIGFTSNVDPAPAHALLRQRDQFSGAIGDTTPLRGITLFAAETAAFAREMKLDGRAPGRTRAAS